MEAKYKAKKKTMPGKRKSHKTRLTKSKSYKTKELKQFTEK